MITVSNQMQISMQAAMKPVLRNKMTGGTTKIAIVGNETEIGTEEVRGTGMQEVTAGTDLIVIEKEKTAKTEQGFDS